MSGLIYDAPNTGWQTAVKLSVDPTISLPIELDKTAIIYVEQWIQHPDYFTPLNVGENHPDIQELCQGNISIANGSTSLIGSGTAFDTELRSGDYVVIDEVKYIVDTISDASSLELTQAFQAASITSSPMKKTKAYLVSEESFENDESGLRLWNRVYATIPANRVEYATQSYTFPAYKDSSSSTGNPIRSSFNKTIVSQVNYSYIRTNDPDDDISFNQAYEILDAEGNEVTFVASDTTPSRTAYEALVSSGTYIQSDETKIKRWRGNIWELRDIKVKAR